MKTTKRAILLILLSSLCAGVGQILWKKASFSLTLSLASLLNFYLISGVVFYVLATGLMILSFREGDLSVLHPFLAVSYIWVTVITPWIFSTESISISKFSAVVLIFMGVYFVSLGGRKANGG